MKEKNLNYFINKSNTSVYVIAEIGVNHEGDIERAKRLIELAAEGGANAVKFQTYKAEKLASKNSPAYWDTTQEPTLSQYELFKKYDSFNLSDYRILHEVTEGRLLRRVDGCLSVLGVTLLPHDLRGVSFFPPAG